MPPPTPSTTRGRRSACADVSVTSAPSLAFGVLEQAGVDLAQRDRERLLARARLHQRTDVLEQAFAELRVVVVDLPGALGRVDHQGVLRADLVEQVVDGGVGDALGDGTGDRAGQRHAHSDTPDTDECGTSAGATSNSTNRSTTACTSSLTTTTSNSSRAAISSTAVRSRRCRTSGVSVPRS